MNEQELLALVDEKVQKALTTSDFSSGGQMTPEVAQRFIKTAIDTSKMLSECRILPMKSDVRRIDSIAFASRIMQAATEATDPGSTSKPTPARHSLTAKEILAAVDVSYSWLEDNIEGPNFAQTLLDMMAERGSADIDELCLYATAVQDPVVDAYLEVLNHRGWLTFTNGDDGVYVKDWGSVVPSGGMQAVFQDLIMGIPKKYFAIGGLSAWRFYVSWEMEQQYREELAERATAAGDKALLENTPVYYKGVPVVWVPKIATSNSNVTDCMLANPKNLIVGFKRNIDMETERQPRARTVEYTLTARMDCSLEQYEAHGIAKNVKCSN